MRSRPIMLLALVMLLAGLFASAALAQDTPTPDTPNIDYEADLETLNDSGATGTATLSLDGNMLTVAIQASGLAPNLPHAQHVHGALESPNTCPPPEADTDGDGFISTPEGVPFYGGINVSLTTEGDTSPDSALAVDRFPVAGADGNLAYSRTIEVPDAVAENLSNLHIVQHGVDVNDSGGYELDAAGPSPLDPDLPFEATMPSGCGEINLASVGGQAVARLGGATRVETAVEISQKAFPDGSQEVYLARADLFADAVAGGVLTQGPVLLVPSCGDLPGAVAAEIQRLAPQTIYTLGGDAAVCDDIVIAAAQARS